MDTPTGLVDCPSGRIRQPGTPKVVNKALSEQLIAHREAIVQIGDCEMGIEGENLAERKANMTVMAWTNSGRFRQSRADIRPELNHIDGLIVMDGGVKILSGGYNLGAVGVSGAPGGEKDAACARKVLENLNERIEFAID